MNLLKTIFFLPIALLFLAITGSNCLAGSSVNCHCFTERSYNAAERFASDDYLLATTFNSLLSRSYNLPKRQIIMIKMNEGVPQDDLLIGLKVAGLTGIDLRKFLRLRKEGSSWAKIISGLAEQEPARKDKILEALSTGMSVEEAGIMAADEMIAVFFQAELEKVAALRKSGLNEKEITLVFILTHASEIPPEALVKQFREQGRSWSEIAHNLGFEPEAAGKLILAYPARQINK